jgi:hypothetical protein
MDAAVKCGLRCVLSGRSVMVVVLGLGGRRDGNDDTSL